MQDKLRDCCLFATVPFVLFPCGPNIWAKSYCGRFSVTNDGRFHQTWFSEDLVLLGSGIVHVAHQGHFLRLTIPIDEIIDSAYRPENTVKLLAGQTESGQIHELILNSPFFEITLRLFRVEALAFSKNLNIQ